MIGVTNVFHHLPCVPTKRLAVNSSEVCTLVKGRSGVTPASPSDTRFAVFAPPDPGRAPRIDAQQRGCSA